MTQGENQPLKAKSASYENNILDNPTGSKYNQRFVNDTRQPSAHHKTMTYLVISLQMLSSLCAGQVLEHSSPLVMHTLTYLRVRNLITLCNHSY